MSLEDYTLNFLHDHWNYVLIKTEIGVIMLFKFEFKYIKLIFKAIASMKFSFDIILWLSCSYVSCLFKKNCRKLPYKISGNSSFTSFYRSKITFDRSSETMIRLFKYIDFRLLVDQSNLFFDRLRGNRVSIEQVRRLGSNFLIFLTDRGTHSIDRKLEIQNFF